VENNGRKRSGGELLKGLKKGLRRDEKREMRT